MAAAKLRYLIAPIENVPGSQLSSEEVLGLSIYRIELNKKSVQEATNDVLKIVTELWSKARIPLQREDTILAKIEKLYKEFGSVKWNKGRAGSQVVREEDFKKRTIFFFFDVAATNALEILRNKEDKALLFAQKEPRRRGKMGYVDTQLAVMESRIAQRREQQESQRKRAADEASTCINIVELESSLSTSGDDTSEDEYGDEEARPQKHAERPTKNMISPSVVASLDATKLTDKEAVYVLSAASQSLGHDASELNIYHSSIRRHRQEHRTDAGVSLKEELQGHFALIVQDARPDDNRKCR